MKLPLIIKEMKEELTTIEIDRYNYRKKEDFYLDNKDFYRITYLHGKLQILNYYVNEKTPFVLIKLIENDQIKKVLEYDKITEEEFIEYIGRIIKLIAIKLSKESER